MHRWSFRSLSLCAVAGSVAAIGVLTASPARSQLGVAKDYVQIQSSTPGTAQSGHANLSGTMRAAQFAGGGGGLTGLNASNLTSGILPLARIPNPLQLSGSDPIGVVRLVGTAPDFLGATFHSTSQVLPGQIGLAASFRSNSQTSPTVYVENFSGSGAGGGLLATTSSPAGTAIRGVNNSSTFGVSGSFSASGTDGTAVLAEATNPTGNAIGVAVDVQSPSGIGVYANTWATTGNATAGFFGTYAPGGNAVRAVQFAGTGASSAIFGTSQSSNVFSVALRGEHTGAGYGGFFSANRIGLRSEVSGSAGIAGEFFASGSDALGVFADVRSGTGVSTGARVLANSSSGFGIQVRNEAVTGVGTAGDFQTNSPNGRGIVSRATASGAGDATAISASSAAIGGIGISANATATSGNTRGLVALAASSSGRAIDAANTATSGFADVIVGTTSSSLGYAVYGINNNGPSTANAIVGEANGANGRAVAGFAGGAGGTAYGVIGQANATTGWSLFAFGRSGASGTKSFRIDHPLDPENKYLLHYSSEGPEPLNIYSGTIVTGKDGFAFVDLPDYFGEINRDPRVQLTVNDTSEDFVMAKVVGEVGGSGFRIRTSKPNVKVYWEVKAVRNDAFVRQYGAPVVVEKSSAERGRYQHPELYGAPVQRGVTYSGRDQAQSARTRRP